MTSKKTLHCIGHGNAIFRNPFEKIHRSFTFPRLCCLFASLRKSSSIQSDKKSRFEQLVLKIFLTAKNSHRPNGQRHQVSSLYSAALRVILVLEFICWEVASPPSSAFAISAALPHVGAAFSFWSFRWVRARLCSENVTNCRHRRDGAGIAFCCSPFLKDA